MTQRQEFEVLRSYDDFEVRQYLPCVIAEVKVSAQYSEATSGAFASLFKYISNGNNSSQKIAMTAPVIAAQRADRSDSNEWYVSLVLRELDQEICVAKSFRGRATVEISRKIVGELRASSFKANIALSDETRICRFDPPFKPGFMHYNEIVIPRSKPLIGLT